MALDELQVRLLLTGDIGGGDKWLAQRHGLEEHIGSGLPHNHIGGDHIRSDLLCKGQGIEVACPFEARQQRLVGTDSQNNLQVLAERQHALDGASKLRGTLATTLQEDGETLWVQPQPLKRLCALRVEGCGEGKLTAHRPTDLEETLRRETNR